MLRIPKTYQHMPRKRRRRSYFLNHKVVSDVGPHQIRPIRVENPHQALLTTRRFVLRILLARYNSMIAYILIRFVSAASTRITIVCQHARISACYEVIVFENSTG